MKMLHILKDKPDDTTKTLMGILSEGKETTDFPLYEGEPDYGRLIDLIFEHDHDKIITWWQLTGLHKNVTMLMLQIDHFARRYNL